MKLKLLAFTLIGSFTFQSCGKEEEKKITKKPIVKNVIEDEFESLEDLLASQDTVTLIKKKSSTSPAPKLKSPVEHLNIPAPGTSGRYVLQVAVESNPRKTIKILEKLKNLGYPAYSIKVDDPGQLEGSWNRIRIGQFKSISDARKFGHAILIPAKFSFWVDLKKNDFKSGTSNSKAFESENRASQPSGNYDKLQAQTFEPVAPLLSNETQISSVKMISSVSLSSLVSVSSLVNTSSSATITPEIVKKEVQVVKENIIKIIPTIKSESIKKAAEAIKVKEAKNTDWSAAEGWE
jgi:hypothetical protein